MPGWNELALREIAGLTYDKDSKYYTGWGGEWGKTPTGMMQRVNVTPGFGGIASHALSAFRVYGAASTVYMGYQEEGIKGAAKWGVSEYISSGLIAARAAQGLGAAGQAGMGLGGMVGTAVTGGSPVGNVAGTYLAGLMVGNAGMGLAGTLAASGLAIGGAGMVAAVGGYYAAKGTYSVLENGYNYRQRNMRKIDTAGSSAAFMNRNAFTMRTRAAQAMQQNYMNVKTAFGSEAQRTHFNAYRNLRNSKVY